ncbi:hypothetical protein O3P69_001607 [Scylla paramamosain]|uniref:Mucin TcMUCII n=1 Tax=Scylla paramamosain TaxID=85552 RepID=A0AAW0UYF1_SCYPA
MHPSLALLRIQLISSEPVYTQRRTTPHEKCVGVAGRSSALERMPMMMARPCFVALLCVALWCGVVFGQEGTSAADPKQDPTPDSGATPAQSPKQMADAGASTTTTTTTTTTSKTTTEGTNAAGGDGTHSYTTQCLNKPAGRKTTFCTEEASSSTDENGAATLSVSLSSMMIATLLAKVYAH